MEAYKIDRSWDLYKAMVTADEGYCQPDRDSLRDMAICAIDAASVFDEVLDGVLDGDEGEPDRKIGFVDPRSEVT